MPVENGNLVPPLPEPLQMAERPPERVFNVQLRDDYIVERRPDRSGDMLVDGQESENVSEDPGSEERPPGVWVTDWNPELGATQDYRVLTRSDRSKWRRVLHGEPWRNPSTKVPTHSFRD